MLHGDKGMIFSLEGRDPSPPVHVEQQLQEVDKLKSIFLLSSRFELVDLDLDTRFQRVKKRNLNFLLTFLIKRGNAHAIISSRDLN